MRRLSAVMMLMALIAATLTAQAQTVTINSPREARIAEGSKLCDQADKLLTAGQAAGALKLYQAALKILPTSPRAKSGVEKSTAATSSPTPKTVTPSPPAVPAEPPLPQDDFPVPTQTQAACPPEALAWPTVIATKLQAPVPWRAFYANMAYNGGSVKPMADDGSEIFANCGPTAMWIRQPVGDQCLLTAEITFTPTDNECSRATFWLAGPGYGTSLRSGYCLQLGTRDGILNAGDAVGEIVLPAPLEVGRRHVVNIMRRGSVLAIWVNGNQAFTYDDPNPPQGPLHRYVAFGATAGAPRVRMCNVRLQAPALPADLAATPSLRVTDPPATVAPSPNGQLLQELKLDGSGNEWYRLQPQAMTWRGDRVILRGPNDCPLLISRQGLAGPFAIEVDLQYIRTVLPQPVMLPQGWPERYLVTGASEA
ncbi:MAG: hypothetical protein ABFE08_10750, partial [Armatimonadia bacterium]